MGRPIVGNKNNKAPDPLVAEAEGLGYSEQELLSKWGFKNRRHPKRPGDNLKAALAKERNLRADVEQARTDTRRKFLSEQLDKQRSKAAGERRDIDRRASQADDTRLTLLGSVVDVEDEEKQRKVRTLLGG